MKRFGLISIIKEILKERRTDYTGTQPSHNQEYPATSTSGYSHGSTNDYSDVQLVRDPLNDPGLNGKLDETYKFKDFKWLAKPDGFGMPTDVYNGSILLGVIISEPDGYVIDRVMSHKSVKGAIPVERSKNNKFKSKSLAANALHRLWKKQRIEQ